MSNAVQFLESLSSNPAVFSQSDYVDAVSNVALKPAVKKALLGRDIRALNFELGGAYPHVLRRGHAGRC